MDEDTPQFVTVEQYLLAYAGLREAMAWKLTLAWAASGHENIPSADECFSIGLKKADEIIVMCPAIAEVPHI